VKILKNFIVERDSYFKKRKRVRNYTTMSMHERRFIFRRIVSGHLNTRITNRLCHGGGVARVVINSHLFNGRYPPIFVSDVTKLFPGFSTRRTIILRLHALSRDNRYPMPMGRISS